MAPSADTENLDPPGTPADEACNANDHRSNTGPSLTGIAVALVAINRFLAATSPQYASHLRTSLESAVAANIGDKDLEVLRLLIKSVTMAV